MVTNVTSLTGNGLRDWLVQRITAIYIGVYVLFLLGYLIISPSINFTQWHHLFSCLWMQVASIIAIFSILLHAWVGIWTVTTDYIKATKLRIIIQSLVLLYLSSLFVWGIHIFWGA